MRWIYNKTHIRRLTESSNYPWFHKIFSARRYSKDNSKFQSVDERIIVQLHNLQNKIKWQ